MRRIVYQFLALASLLGSAAPATRPHYGGTLRVSLQSAPALLEAPANATGADYWDSIRILGLVADNLVTLDDQGRPRPALALAWQSDANARHWQLTLRPAVRFHDGSAFSAAAVMQILGPAHPEWTIRGTGDTLTIDSDSSMPFLLAELALPRNLIFRRNADQLPIGSGAYRVAEFQPGRSLKLSANETCWAGRPFIDSIEIEMGRSPRDQAIALELGRTDVVALSPAAIASSQRVRTSLPVELMALVFAPNSRMQDLRLRQALALSIDRKPIQSVLLRGAAEPAASLLPNWMTGYSALFPIQPDARRAGTLISGLRFPAFNLSYDPRDPQAQLIAERIALNAREAGIILQVSLSRADDVRLMRIVLPSPDPAISMREVARQLGLPSPTILSGAVGDLYQAERGVLHDYTVIPLFHLPVAAGANARVHNWEPGRLGQWNLPSVWLEAGAP